MATEDKFVPRLIPQITVSSTFVDLEAHRTALIKCIKANGLAEVAMENDSAKIVDVIDSSLQMVRDGSAYIGIISLRYGNTPPCPRRNPNELSITELEFNEALRLERPILLFIMGEDHQGRKDDFENDPAKLKKLNAFRESAKCISRGVSVHRVFAEFNSLDEFIEKIGPSVAGLRRYLDARNISPQDDRDGTREVSDAIPKPPVFYAVPNYIGSHAFIGRVSQLQELSDWALPADSHSVLLLEAIGGNGKSMLTWEWASHHATIARSDWAGRFWYSFYERGAIMADFCRRALAYMTGQSMEGLRKKRMPDLTAELLAQLRAKPWLIILDGLERVLVAYHRIDAAEIPDEEANLPTDKIVNRDPCSAIRDDDEVMLRSLASAGPSKILASSRLTPLAMLNSSNQPIPGVRRISLPGLRPPDAEALLVSCGIRGDSDAIRAYLMANCDCHPLVIGVLAGLINDYLPDRGNFDAWSSDPEGGGRLDLASLDLIQRRNHILRAALNALSERSAQLLCTLALLQESVDYPTLSALNPHLPAAPERVEEPADPREHRHWRKLTDVVKSEEMKLYQHAMEDWAEYKQAAKTRLESAAFRDAPKELTKTIHDLERRGLLQYDGRTKRYDLHPVVRGVAAGGLKTEERERYGQRLVDHFSHQAHNPYEQAETLDDVRNGMNLVRALLQTGRLREACHVFRYDLAQALVFKLNANPEILMLIRPFFIHGWNIVSSDLGYHNDSFILTAAARSLSRLGELNDSLDALEAALKLDIENQNWTFVRITLIEIHEILCSQNRLAESERINVLGISLESVCSDDALLFRERLDRFEYLARIGRWEDAMAAWKILDPEYRGWRAVNQSHLMDCVFAQFHFWRGDLSEEHLARAEQIARVEKNKAAVQSLKCLRGQWQIEQGHWELALASFQEAVRMAREAEIHDAGAEAGLALAKLRLGKLDDPFREVERLACAQNPPHRILATLWASLGNDECARKHATAAYRWAWSDGEPYVNRYELSKTCALLESLRIPTPRMAPYNQATIVPFSWENVIARATQTAREHAKPKQ